MYDADISISWGGLLTAVLTTAAVGLLGVSWWLEEDHLAYVALMLTQAVAALLVMRDNARTRRVVRAASREGGGGSGVRSVRS